MYKSTSVMQWERCPCWRENSHGGVQAMVDDAVLVFACICLSACVFALCM